MKKVFCFFVAILMMLTLAVPALADSEEDYFDLVDEAEGYYPEEDFTQDEEDTIECEDPNVGFSDVPNNAYYYEPVLWAVENQITSGTGKNTFSPDKTCTRAEMVTFLWRSAGRPEPVSSFSPFEDVSADAYYFKPVIWAVENGITSGTGASTFSPNKVCNRGECVTFLWRYAGKPEPVSESGRFSDVKESDFFHKPTLWAAEQKITSGTRAGFFSPADACTRGQVVTFLFRYAH